MPGNWDTNFDWWNMQDKAHGILGEDFWNQINRVIPKRGPCVDVYKTKNEVVVIVEIPGIKPTDKINMRLRGFKLLIDGKIPNTYPVSEEDMIQSERFLGEFKREIELPHDILTDGKINAQFRNGLIEIRVPKQPLQKEKRISIEFEE